jgi:hypothetical protein
MTNREARVQAQLILSGFYLLVAAILFLVSVASL